MAQTNNPAAPISRAQRLIPTAILLLALALLLPRLLTFAQVSTGFVLWPWQFDYTEGVNLSATMQLADGRNIYRPNGPNSFVSAPYTPLFYLLTAPASLVIGPELWFGRALSLAATLAIAILIAYIVRRATSNWPGGILAGALWLCLSPVIVWSALNTQHIIALAFGLTGLAWAYRYPDSRRLYFAALLLALAFYTKQSAFDAAGAAAIWLLLRDPRTGLQFGLALAACFVLPFAAANILLKGGLWEHAFGNQALPSSDRRFWRLLGRLFGEYWPILGLAAGSVLAIGVGQVRTLRERVPIKLPDKGSVWTLATLYFLFALASVLVRLGRDGANYNHMIDVLLPACLLTGLCAGALFGRKQPASRSLVSNILPSVLLGALLLVQVFLLADPRTWYSGGWPGEQLDRQMRSLSAQIAETPGDIYSEDAYLALSNNRPTLFDDAFMFVSLANAGRWDESVFVQSLKDRRFSMVLLQNESERMTPAMREAFQQNYSLKFSDLIATYVPKPMPDAPQYSFQCTLSNQQDSIQLEGYSLGQGIAWTGIKPGEVLRVHLYWRPTATTEGSYATYVHMINDRNEPVATVDHPQTGANGPTNTWTPTALTPDTASLPISANLPPGPYRLIAGMYNTAAGTIEPLSPTCDNKELFGQSILLGSVEVR